jgi:hypothetical protein
LLNDLNLRKLQRDHDRALLTLRRHATHRDPVELEREIIAMRPNRRSAARSISGAMARKLHPKRLRVLRGTGLISNA